MLALAPGKGVPGSLARAGGWAPVSGGPSFSAWQEGLPEPPSWAGASGLGSKSSEGLPLRGGLGERPCHAQCIEERGGHDGEGPSGGGRGDQGCPAWLSRRPSVNGSQVSGVGAGSCLTGGALFPSVHKGATWASDKPMRISRISGIQQMGSRPILAMYNPCDPGKAPQPL